MAGIETFAGADVTWFWRRPIEEVLALIAGREVTRLYRTLVFRPERMAAAAVDLGLIDAQRRGVEAGLGDGVAGGWAGGDWAGGWD